MKKSQETRCRLLVRRTAAARPANAGKGELLPAAVSAKGTGWTTPRAAMQFCATFTNSVAAANSRDAKSAERGRVVRAGLGGELLRPAWVAAPLAHSLVARSCSPGGGVQGVIVGSIKGSFPSLKPVSTCMCLLSSTCTEQLLI